MLLSIASTMTIFFGVKAQEIDLNGDFFVEVSESSLNDEQAKQLTIIKELKTTNAYRIVNITMLSEFLHAGSIDLNIFPGKFYKAIRIRTEKRADLDFIWIGMIDNNPGSVIFVRGKEGLIGTIWADWELYKVEPLGLQLHVIRRIDQSKFPVDHQPGYIHGENSMRPILNNVSPKVDDPTANRSNAVVGILVVYTQAVANKCNENYIIQLAENETNQSFSNSQVGNVSIDVVHKRQVNYNESGKSYSQHVYWLKNNNDIEKWRNQYGGDIALLLVDDNELNGLAYKILAQNPDEAFCAVYYESATGYYSFGHELGHLHGCYHDIDADRTPSRYHGYIYDAISPDWRTIMEINRPSVSRIQYW